MKILFLARLFYPHIGGVEKHLMEISKVLLKEGYEVSVITEELDFTTANKNKVEEINGLKIYRIARGENDRFKKLRIWKEMWQLRELIEKADVVHCHDVFFWYLPFRFLYPHKPVYTTFHGYESYPIKKKAVWMRKLSEKLSWGNICIGDFIAKWYGTKPTFVSYGGVHIDNNHYSSKMKVNNQSALFIGRIDEQTGALTYAKAAEIVKKKYPKFNLTFIGDGKDRDKIEKKFRVLGFQKDPEKYFQNYHFAFVSRYLSILEAFAAKKLVFAVYDNPIKEDYLRMTPYANWIVMENDPKKLARKIEFYIEHSYKGKMITEQSYKWVQTKSWDNVVSLYKRLWNK